jgi:hypothetical protein
VIQILKAVEPLVKNLPDFNNPEMRGIKTACAAAKRVNVFLFARSIGTFAD